jgi:hypothetical protein
MRMGRNDSWTREWPEQEAGGNGCRDRGYGTKALEEGRSIVAERFQPVARKFAPLCLPRRSLSEDGPSALCPLRFALQIGRFRLGEMIQRIHIFP